MRMTYDPEADALAIDLLKGKTVRMAKLAPNVNVDFDAEGRLTSIEIQGASAWYPRAQLEQLGAGADWLTLQEAAAAAAAEGEPLSPDTLRSQIHKGKLPAEKQGRDLVVTRHNLMTYLENRAPQGRRAAGSPHRRRVGTVATEFFVVPPSRPIKTPARGSKKAGAESGPRNSADVRKRRKRATTGGRSRS